MNTPLFIAGTGTGVGKTLVTSALCHQLTCGGYKVCALKPVVSGFSYEDAQSDPALILKALGRAHTREQVDAITGWRYAAPLSPHMAAWTEGNAATASAIAQFCADRAKGADAALAEGAGGIMSPLNDRETMLDVCAVLGWPVVLVAGSYLGALSHTLTALAAMQAKGVTLQAVVLSESADSTVSLEDTARSIRLFAHASTPLYTIPRLPAQEDPWKSLPDLTPLFPRSSRG